MQSDTPDAGADAGPQARSGDPGGTPGRARGHAEGRVLGFVPSGRIAGELAVPGSKSIAQRALVCAGLAGGSTRIAGLPDGDDVRVAVELVERVGGGVERTAPAAVRVHGRPPGPQRGWTPTAPVSVGESGTLARLATAALALCGRTGATREVHAAGTLRSRTSPPLFDALRRAGVVFESEGSGWPARFMPIGPPSTVALHDPVSSQELSALWIALGAWPDALRVEVTGPVPSRPYLGLTRDVLARFGAEVELLESPGGGAEAATWEVRGPLVPPADPLIVEPDASSAAVALGAACLTGGELVVPRLGASSAQGDVRIVEYLERFGCRAAAGADGLRAGGRPSRGAEVDLTGEPDLAPVLAVVAAAAAESSGASSRLAGLGTLEGKESPRLSVLAEALAATGFAVDAERDALRIGPRAGQPTAGDVVLDPRGDHRMAFAFALLGFVLPGVRVLDPECVGKSWPGFWDALCSVGACRADSSGSGA